MLKKLYIAISMDCERIGSKSPSGGPGTWLVSEKAIRGFSEFLISVNFPPYAFHNARMRGKNQAFLFRELEEKGVELGMHMHPQEFLDHRYKSYLGQHDKNTQLADTIQR